MYEPIFAGLQNLRKTRRGWTARCPAHEDRRASLSVAVADDGRRLLVHCFAGCRPEEIARALGVELKDFFAGESSGPREDAPPRHTKPDLMSARYVALAAENLARARRGPYLDYWSACDLFRIAQKTVRDARKRASELGDPEEALDLLRSAADLDTSSRAVLNAEAEAIGLAGE